MVDAHLRGKEIDTSDIKSLIIGGQTGVDGIRFCLASTVNGEDLTDPLFSWFLQFKNKYGAGESVSLTPVYEDNLVKLPWIPGVTATQVSGKLQIQVYATKVVGETVVKCWVSEPSTIYVEENLDPTEIIPVEPTVLEEYLTTFTSLKNEASGFADEAESWAEESEDVEVEAGKYSAKHHALKAAQTYSNFDTRYLGEKAADPATDNEGNALVAGAIYFNTTTSTLKFFSGSLWVDAMNGAGDITYNNTSSGLAAENAQDAIDQLSSLKASREEAVSLNDRLSVVQKAYSNLKAETYHDEILTQYADVFKTGEGYDESDIDVDVSAVDGAFQQMLLKGLRAKNDIENSKFLSGINNWSSDQANSSITDRLVSITGTGSAYYSALRQLTSIPTKTGDKIFVILKMRVTNAIADRFEVQIHSGSYLSAFTQSNPVQDQWYTAFGIITAGADTIGTLRIITFYDDAASASGQVTQIDADYGVLAVNLSRINMDSLTVAQAKGLLPYIAGSSGIGEVGAEVTGRNLFDRDSSDIGSLSTVSGVEVGSEVYVRSDYIPISDLSSYASSVDSGYTIVTPLAYDNNLSFLSVFTITSPPSGAKYCRMRIRRDDSSVLSPDDIEAILSSYIFNIGSSALPYEPHKTSFTFLPEVGNHVPSAHDTVEWDDARQQWKKTQRVSDEYSIVSTDISISSNDGSSTLFFIDTSTKLDNNGLDSATEQQFTLSGFNWIDLTGITPSNPEECGYRPDLHRLYVRVTGVYTTEADIVTALGANFLLYELATPIVTYYDLPPLPCWEGGQTRLFNGAQKVALYGTGISFDENILIVRKAIKFSAGVETDITDDAVIIDATITFGTAPNSNDVVHIQVEYVPTLHPITEYIPPVENASTRLTDLEARVAALEA